MNNITNSLLLLALCVPLLHAAKPTPWDWMPTHSISGLVLVTTKDGKKHKGRGADFTSSEVTVITSGESFLRADVKQVVIRVDRNFCCDAIKWPLVPFALGSLINEGQPLLPVAALVVLVPMEAGALAVGPPVAAVQGIKRLLTPAKILYRVVP